MSRVKERWLPTWQNNRDLALLLEEAGLEFLVPFSRWRGLGGASNPMAVTLDPLTWAAALSAVTRRITLFTTVHTPYLHPVAAAKQIATMEQISGRPLGLNVVSGWNQDEFEMFGMEQLEHDTRYEYTREWLDVVTRIWTSDEPFDYQGRFFNLRGVVGEPRPKSGNILLMSAGTSKAGRRFAVERCDRLFTILESQEMGRALVAECKEAADRAGRAVDVYTTAYVVCRPTQKEAEEYHDYFSREMADDEAADHLMKLLGVNSQSFTPEHYRMFRRRFVGGHGNYPIIGDPDHVALEIRRLRDAGFQGLAMVFVNYAEEFIYFREEVLPRLRDMGVRRAS
jgi:alkanesulfonate monooxygenase SsuD/methylene tetrahydromethanopterin reductase-like flavin-dependent oxidoreductase (luciferase family)